MDVREDQSSHSYHVAHCLLACLHTHPRPSLSTTIEAILKRNKVIAVVGCSRDPTKDAHTVPRYMKGHGYRIIPINPFADEILGERCYKSLADMPEHAQKIVEVVNIFRPSEDVPPIVEQSIRLREKYGRLAVIWTQLGIMNEAAAKRAEDAGLAVVMDRCIMVEHRRLSSD